LTDREIQKPSLTKPRSKPNHAPTGTSSTLFLQIYAAADYYTLNKTMMENAPPVFVDIILDPYLLNIFPQSLLSTAVYIVILAIGGWYLAKYISALIQSIGELDKDAEKKRL
jgi:hypothetical protein